MASHIMIGMKQNDYNQLTEFRDDLSRVFDRHVSYSEAIRIMLAKVAGNIEKVAGEVREREFSQV
jgi:hypothetical protein